MSKPDDVPPPPPPWSPVQREDDGFDVPADEDPDEGLEILPRPAHPLQHHDSERRLPPPVSGSIDYTS